MNMNTWKLFIVISNRKIEENKIDNEREVGLF